jgi:membrane fusion protein
MPPQDSPAERLFRTEAIESQRTQLLGQIILTPRISTLWMSLGAAMMAIALVAFLFLGSYTRRVTVSGQLMPAGGLIRVHTPQLGVVLEKHVNNGQSVKKGQLLYVLNSDRPGDGAQNLQADIARQTAERRASLAMEVDRSRLMQSEEAAGLRRRGNTLKAEVRAIEAQIEQQKTRIQYADDTRKRYQSLADQDYIARDELRQKEIDLSEARSRLQALQRDALTAQRELQQIQQEIDSSQLRYENQVAQLEREISNTDQQLTEVESRRRVVITAPQEGQVTLVSAEVGQTIDSSQALLTLVPAGSELQARLYAPSSSIGFVQPGDAVMLRYQAFPYQKFGQHPGVVSTISTTTVSPAELASLSLGSPTAQGGVASGEPVFSIQVKLKNSHIETNGQPRALQAGMQLEADILQERRKLYEWVLEPLYGVTKRLDS